MESLADFLGLTESQMPGQFTLDQARLLDEKLTGQQFCEALLDSFEFRVYVVNSLRLGTLPAAVLCRVMDRGWGKLPDKVEHTGKDGKPIEMVTEVRRTIIRAPVTDVFEEQEEKPVTTH